jgi:7-cyano-7-deazaguanine synthase
MAIPPELAIQNKTGVWSLEKVGLTLILKDCLLGSTYCIKSYQPKTTIFSSFDLDHTSEVSHCPGKAHLMSSAAPRAATGQNHSAKVLVLASGGIDSSACISFYISHGAAVEALFIDYGQLSKTNEENAVFNIAAHFQIKLRVVRCNLGEFGAGVILGRNGFFLNAALVAAGTSCGVVAVGIHAGTSYADCSPSFVREMQKVFDLQTDGLVQIGAPFLNWEKLKIWHYCKTNAVPVELTYSCENGQSQPCDHCLSCTDLKCFYAMAR